MRDPSRWETPHDLPWGVQSVPREVLVFALGKTLSFCTPCWILDIPNTLDSSDFSCFWQESVLPEGPAAKALQEMTKPKRIAITDSFWLDLSCGKHQTCTFEVAWASENWGRKGPSWASSFMKILGLYPHLKDHRPRWNSLTFLYRMLCFKGEKGEKNQGMQRKKPRFELLKVQLPGGDSFRLRTVDVGLWHPVPETTLHWSSCRRHDEARLLWSSLFRTHGAGCFGVRLSHLECSMVYTDEHIFMVYWSEMD